MESLWSATASLPVFPRLEADKRTDVLIIGGGMAGLLCAYLLEQAGVSYLLVEAGEIGAGVTGNTTGKITAQHGLEYTRLLKEFPVELVRQHWQAQTQAVEDLSRLCRKIPCDFQEKDSFVFARDNLEALEKEALAMAKVGAAPELVSNLPLPFVAQGLKIPRQGQFHPLKFLEGIARGLHIYEHTRVLDLSGNTAVTDRGDIRGEKIIVATHFPFLNRYGAYFLKMYQQRSYVLALEEAAQVEGMYIEAEPGGLSFRNYGNLLLLGGGGHRTGKAGGGWEYLRREAQRYYPAARECYHWAAQDCMTLDGMAYVGPYSRGTRNLYVATGFHKWGMTGSMAAATLLRDMVLEKENPYARVFAPDRPMLRPQLGVNAWEATRSLLTFRTPRCPHLGCSLVWNPQEHAWECPCHGSRFSQSGKVLDNPANKNMKKK